MKQRGLFKRQSATVLIAMAACGSLVAGLAREGAFGRVQEGAFRDVPVVMIVLDELPIATLMDENGRVDAGLFPNFARIQRDSTWFRNTTTPALFTREALPSILTGIYPDKVPPAAGRSTIFSLLSGSYDIPLRHQHELIQPDSDASADRNTLRSVCPPSACDEASASTMVLADRYGHLFPGKHGLEFLQFLSYIRDKEEPTFYFIHYVMPHQPWRFLPTGQTYTQMGTVPGAVDVPGQGNEWVEDEWLVAQAYQRHLLQTSLLDRQLGLLIDRLEDENLYEQSLILLTADHGIAFKPGASKRVVEPGTAGHISAVPLFVKEPFQSQGRITDVPLETVDVVPTIVDVLSSSDVPLGLDGMSAYEEIPAERARTSEGVPLSARLKSKFRAAEMKYELFGRSGGGIDLFQLGPGRTRTFVGRAVAEFDITSPAETTVTFENGADIESATRDMPLLPALLEGRLDGDAAPAHAKIAVALNDRVVAMTRSYRHTGGKNLVRFYALIQPKWFTSRPNDLDVYLVEDAATKRLAPLLEDPAESSGG